MVTATEVCLSVPTEISSACAMAAPMLTLSAQSSAPWATPARFQFRFILPLLLDIRLARPSPEIGATLWRPRGSGKADRVGHTGAAEDLKRPAIVRSSSRG